MRKLFLLLFTSFIYTLTFAQQQISGKIGDDQGNPLPGVSITVMNKPGGTMSDINGTYSISVSPSDTLVYTMVGMSTQKIAVRGRTAIDVKMLTEVTGLNEVVVVGYGTQRVKDLTAPIAIIKGDEVSKQTTASPMQALQGKVAGLQVVNNGGAPGTGVTVKIRGTGSIGDYASPLYVVDGVFVNNIDFLSDNDIEDITILKDASAAAIYGVRAANGVVLITTRKGVEGRPPTITYDGYVGAQVPVNIMKMTNTSQYVTLQNEANKNTDGYVPLTVAQFNGANTNWYKELLRNAFIQNHSLDVTGAKEKTIYSFGVNYLYQNGILKAQNDYSRLNIRAKVDYQMSENVKVGFSAVLSNHIKNNANATAFFQAFINPPVYNVYDPNNTAAYPVKFASAQSAGLGNEYGNPVALNYYNDNEEKGYNLIPSVYLELTFLQKKLTFRSQFSENLNDSTINDYTPQYFVGGSQGITQSNLVKTFVNNSKKIVDNTLTFKNSYHGKHEVSLMIGNSVRIEQNSFLTGSAVNVPGIDPQSKYLVNGSYTDRSSTDGGYVYDGLSYFARGTYNLNQKYLATVTFRADASSKYQQKWGYFPSVGLGWIMSSENFMKNQNLFQDLKMRVSWGLLGNDNVPANSYTIVGASGSASSGVFGGVLVPGIGAQTVYQNYLKWEVVNEFDVGFDFTMLKKLRGNLDAYSRTTNNVVFSAPIASGGGAINLLGNNGSVRNSGIELTLNWTNNISQEFSYSLGMNATFLKNEVTKVNGYGANGYIPGAMVNGVYATRDFVGKPIGAFYGYKVVGVYQTQSQVYQDPVAPAWAKPGFLKYEDVNGDGKIDQNDMTYLGSPIPWFMGGIDFGLNYKKLDFSVSFQGQLGNKILNQKRMNKTVFPASNYDEDFYKNRWTAAGSSNTYPSAEAMANSNIQQPNSFFVENGAYIRIQNVQVGYTTQAHKLGTVPIPKMRFYISAQRPLLITGYNGFSPDIGGTPNAMGIDNTVYPMQAIYTIGVRAIF
ncbi:MAG TPA: TonB-dependent receptor [Bacteroidales bacterium]